jgi:hypothetical protein
MRELNKEKLEKVANGIIDLVMEKNETYENSLFDQGEYGIFLRVSDKYKRISNIIGRYDVKTPDYTMKEKDAIANALIDIVGYCIGWLSEFVDDKLLENELGDLW